jgi:hypothetical protein
MLGVSSSEVSMYHVWEDGYKLTWRLNVVYAGVYL